MFLIERMRKCIFYWENDYCEENKTKNVNKTIKGLKFKTNSINDECLTDLFRYIDLYLIALNNYKNGIVVEYDNGKKSKTIVENDVKLKFKSSVSSGVKLSIRRLVPSTKIHSSDTYIKLYSSSFNKYKSFDIDIDVIYLEKYGIIDTSDVRDEFRRIIKNKYGKGNTINYSSGFIISYEQGW